MVCIYCKFTWGLQCCGDLGLRNAVRYVVMDGFVNSGVQTKWDWGQLEARERSTYDLQAHSER